MSQCPACDVELPADGHRHVEVFGIKVLTCPSIPFGEVQAIDERTADG